MLRFVEGLGLLILRPAGAGSGSYSSKPRSLQRNATRGASARHAGLALRQHRCSCCGRALAVRRSALSLGFKDFKTWIFQSEDHLKLRSQSHPPRSHYQGPASTSCRRNLENRIWGRAAEATRQEQPRAATSKRSRAAAAVRAGGGQQAASDEEQAASARREIPRRRKAKAKSWADIKLTFSALWLSKTLASRKRAPCCRECRLDCAKPRRKTERFQS